MKARLLVTIQVSILNNIQSSIQEYTKAHTLVTEHTQDSMQTNIKSYILETGLHSIQVNTIDNLKELEHTLVNILVSFQKFGLVQTIKNYIQNNMKELEHIMDPIQLTTKETLLVNILSNMKEQELIQDNMIVLVNNFQDTS